MPRFRMGVRVLAALLLLAGLAQAVRAEVTVQQILAYTPKQSVDVTTPSGADVANCKIELEKGAMLGSGKQATAWVVRDAKGVVLRKFHDTTGAGGVNMFAYYKDGEEVYREMVGKNGKVDQYRWLGSAGSRWGVDLDGDGVIDTWQAISAEELSQELLAALIKQDVKRMQALMITATDLETLGLPEKEVDRIKDKTSKAAAQFQKTCKELKGLTAKAIWVHLETRQPEAIAADTLGSKEDLVHYRHGTILYQESDDKNAKHNWLQTGELIQVGKAWRIIQAPTTGMEPDPGQIVKPDGNGNIRIPEGGAGIVEEINKLDAAGPGGTEKAKIVPFNLKRASLLEQLVQLFKEVKDRPARDMWLKQVGDCLAAAAQQGDKTAFKRLGQWHEALEKDPESTALPYFVFREMSAEYAQRLPSEGKDVEKLNKLQEWWKDKLTKFINDFPKAEDTPDAILQLGTVNEYFGSKTEAEAKAAYALLVKNFPAHPLAKRAQGCLDRLSLEGSAIRLSATTLGGEQFNITGLAGKAVVVYYWASWNELAANDFNKIKAAMKDYAGKAELVGVNLDAKAEDAAAFIKSNAVPGTHVFMPGGFESPLAVQYGITALPVMFLVGPDGKVVTRHVQAATLDDELKKLFKAPEKDK